MILLNAVVSSTLFAVKIAVIQYEIKDPNKVGVDAERLESFIREAAARGAGLVVSPETGFYRYEPWEQDGVTMLDLANSYDALKNKFSALAVELNISLDHKITSFMEIWPNWYFFLCKNRKKALKSSAKQLLSEKLFKS